MQPNPQSAIDSGIARQFGFTLIELMITLSVLGIVLTVGVPSFSRMIEKQRVTEVAEEFYSHLQEARLVAIARSEPVYFKIDADDPTDWAVGWRCPTPANSATYCDPSDDDPPCTIWIDEDFDGVEDGDEPQITQKFTSADHPGIQLAVVNDSIEFDPRRGTADNGAPGNTVITMTSTGGAGLQVIAEVAPLGHIRLCSPAGNSHVSRYTSTTCP